MSTRALEKDVKEQVKSNVLMEDSLMEDEVWTFALPLAAGAPPRSANGSMRLCELVDSLAAQPPSIAWKAMIFHAPTSGKWRTLAVLFVLCTAFAATLGFDAAFIPTTIHHAAARVPTLRRRTNTLSDDLDDAATRAAPPLSTIEHDS